MNKNTTYNIVFKPYSVFSQFDSVKEYWKLLLRKCPHYYSQSWGWIETWIKNLPPDCNLSLIVGFINDSPVIAFFLGSKTIIRHRFFRIRQISLNSTLIEHIDNATHIEYNTILIDPNLTISINYLLKNLPLKWDELYMQRCAPSQQFNFLIKGISDYKYNITTTKQKSYFVNLDQVRQNNNDYLSLLSQNRRKQILRSLKKYEKKMGKLKIHIADNPNDALNIYQELIEMHQKRWTKRGHPGSFSNEYPLYFYKELITKQFEHGEILLMKISAGSYTIGCLYHYIYNKKVMGLLSGLNYLPENFFLPGFVCVYYAVLHNATAGFECYDLMEGDFQQKRSLSTNSHELDDILITKKNLKYYTEKLAVMLHRIYKPTLHL